MEEKQKRRYGQIPEPIWAEQVRRVALYAVIALAILLPIIIILIVKTPGSGGASTIDPKNQLINNLVNDFARTITEKDLASNIGLFIPSGTLDMHRLMTFLFAPNLLTMTDWQLQMDVFFGEFVTNHMSLNNIQLVPLTPTSCNATAIGYYTYTLDAPMGFNLPSVMGSFSILFTTQQQPNGQWLLTYAEALPNATNTFVWYSSSGVEPPGPILTRNSRSLQSDQVRWDTLQMQINSLFANGQTQAALAVCNTTQYLTLKAEFDPMGTNSSLLCNVVTHQTELTIPLVCSGEGQVDASCIKNLNVSLSLQNLTLQNLEVVQTTTLDGNVFCAHPIWPSCLDISGQACTTIPLQESCMPYNVSTWHVRNTLTLEGNMTCANPLPVGCLPTTFTYQDLTVLGNLYVLGNFSQFNQVTQERLSVDVLEVNQTIICNGPTQVPPTCFDISNKTCPGGALDSSCVPSNLSLRNVTISDTLIFNQATVTGHITCINRSIDPSCMPTSVAVYNATVGRLTIMQSATCTMGATISAGCMPSAATFQNLTLSSGGGFACATPNSIDKSCIDISGKSCPNGNLMSNCLPATATFSSLDIQGGLLTCSMGGALSQTCLDISGLSCPLGSLGNNCLPASANFTTLHVTNPLTCGAPADYSCLPTSYPALSVTSAFGLFGQMTCSSNQNVAPSCFTIDNKTCPTGALDQSCMNRNLIVNSLTCTNGVNSIDPGCINVDISAKTCTSPLSDTCIPSSIIFQNLQVLGGTILGPNTTCAAPIESDCIDLNNIQCPNGPVSHSCIPTTGLVLNDLVVFNLTVLGTQTAVSLNAVNATSLNVNLLFVNQTFMSGPLTCVGTSATIDSDCFSIDGKHCNSPLDNSCLPHNQLLANLTVADTLNVNDVVCTHPFNKTMCLPTYFPSDIQCSVGDRFGASCLDISGAGTCSSPVAQSCIPNVPTSKITCDSQLALSCIAPIRPSDLTCTPGFEMTSPCFKIDNSTCAFPISSTCLPPRVATINGAAPNGLLDFSIQGTGSISVTTNTSGIFIHDNHMCDGDTYYDASCLNISNAVCTSPVSDSCAPKRIKTINGIQATSLLDFSILGGTNMAVVPGVNSITLNTLAEINTASNIGTLGVGVFSGKSGVDLQFRNVAPGSSKVTTTLDGNNNIRVDVITGNLGITPSDLTCTGPALSQSCYDISMISCPLGAINADCVQIDGETCLSPIADSCTPTRIKTINSILPSGTLNFGITAGSGVTITPGVNGISIAATGSGGTVTSVGLSLPVSVFTIIGSPVTGAGTITATFATQNANLVFAGPTSGGAATPAFRALVAADVPNLDTSKLTTGILPIARGGTNSGTALNNNRLMWSAGGAIVEATALTNGQLFIGSTGAAPVAATLTGTSNQVNVAVSAGGITLSLPQNIHTAATPTFASMTLSAASNQVVLGTTNTVTLSASAPAASRVYTLHDAGGNANLVLNTGGALTITNTATTGQVLTATGTNTATWQAATGANDPDATSCFFDDFVSGDSTANNNYHGSIFNYLAFSSGTGAQVGPDTTLITSSTDALGVSALTTGTTATGRCTILMGGSSMLAGIAALTFTTRVTVSATPTFSQNYIAYVGFQDNTASGASTDGIYFTIDRTLSTTNWYAVTRSNGAQTATNTGVAVSALTFAKFGISVNAAGTSVAFTINGSTVATITTNIPSGAGRWFDHGFKIEKSAGTTPSLLYVDYIQWCTTYSGTR
jgi:hypothetical protein